VIDAGVTGRPGEDRPVTFGAISVSVIDVGVTGRSGRGPSRHSRNDQRARDRCGCDRTVCTRTVPSLSDFSVPVIDVGVTGRSGRGPSCHSRSSACRWSMSVWQGGLHQDRPVTLGVISVLVIDAGV